MIIAIAMFWLSSGDLALLLLLCGLLLIYAEFNRPGTIVLAAVGMLLMMLGVDKLLPLACSPAAAALAAGGAGVVLLELRFPFRGPHRAGIAAGTLALIAGLRFFVLHNAALHWTVAVFIGALWSAVTYGLGSVALLAAHNKRLPAAQVS